MLQKTKPGEETDMETDKKTIKLSAVHAKYLDVPPEADPNSDCFSESAALRYVNANIGNMMGWLEEAGKNRVDLVCTHEDFTHAGHFCRCFAGGCTLFHQA